MTFREIVYPADQPLYDEYNRALFAGRSATTEVRVYHRDGRLLWAQITAHATPPARPGEPVVVIGAGRDITALKQAEAALRASEARYRAAVDQQAEQVCRFSVPDYRITFANEAYARFYRRAQAELIGLGIADLVPPDVHAVAVAQLRAITPANPAQVVEMYSAGPDGELRWRQWSDTAVFDAEGRIVEIQSVGRDITELKLVEAELRQLNAELEARVAERTAELRRANEELRRGGVLLRTVVDTLSDGIALIRPDGVILVANAGLGALLGVAPEGLVGTAWAGPALPAAELVLAAAAEGRPRSGRELFVGADGRRRVLDVQVGLPETREAGAERLVIRLSDVTERLQLERMVIENERLAASGRLAAIAAHEINTPLQSVQNLLYLAVQGSAAGDGVDDLIALSLDEIGRVSGILRRLLSLSQIAAGDEAPADCNTVIERVMLLTGSTLARKRIALDRGLATGLPPVRLGGDLITQVLLNLVVNAIDAMPRGGRLRVGTAVVAGPAVELIIHDTGDGISPEDQVRIFEPFFTRKEGGTGLGLAVSRHIVEQAGGELLVESALGAGTTFTVRLPVAGEGA